MGRRKSNQGHYCIVCGSRKANERFTGKGHSRHICKDCSKKSPELQKEQIDINTIYGLYRYSNLSKNNKKMLMNFLSDKRDRVRKAAEAIYNEFYPKRNHLEFDDFEYSDDGFEYMDDDPGYLDTDQFEEDCICYEPFGEDDEIDVPF